MPIGIGLMKLKSDGTLLLRDGIYIERDSLNDIDPFEIFHSIIEHIFEGCAPIDISIISGEQHPPFRIRQTSQHDFKKWLASNVPTATLNHFTINCANDADAALIKLFWQDSN